MKNLVIALSLFAVTITAHAAKPCDELKAEIAAKLDAKGVKSYTLTVVPNDKVMDSTVVGSCDGGTNKITYSKK